MPASLCIFPITPAMLSIAAERWSPSTSFPEGTLVLAYGQIWRSSGGESNFTAPDWDSAPEIGDTVVD